MTGATTSGELRSHNLARVLRAVHDGGARATRSELTRDLGLARGTAAVLIGELTDLRLVHEEPAPQRTRGRPTGVPGPHPQGPLALAIDLREDGWSIATVELGGALTVLEERPHPGNPPSAVLSRLATSIGRHLAELAPRVVGAGIAVPGPVRDGRLLDIAELGWRDIRLADRLPTGGLPVLLGNDATVAALAEARRGALRSIDLGLHLHLDFGIGGALVLGGNPLSGARGTAGEFGHLPLTGDRRRCFCGATGCWGLQVGGSALLEATGARIGPDRGRAEVLRILTWAADGDPDCVAAVHDLARALGAGIGALVNALDPRRITLSGLGPAILANAGDTVRTSYHGELMTFRRDRPPEVVPSALADEATLTGAAELVFDTFLTPTGLTHWH